MLFYFPLEIELYPERINLKETKAIITPKASFTTDGESFKDSLDPKNPPTIKANAITIPYDQLILAVLE